MFISSYPMRWFNQLCDKSAVCLHLPCRYLSANNTPQFLWITLWEAWGYNC